MADQSSHPIFDSGVPGAPELTREQPYSARVTYRALVRDAPENFAGSIYPRYEDGLAGISEAGVGSAGTPIPDWDVDVVLLRREGRLVAAHVTYDVLPVEPPPDQGADFTAGAVDEVEIDPVAVFTDIETLPDDVPVPDYVNIWTRNDYFTTYGGVSSVRASVVGVAGGAALYTEVVSTAPGDFARSPDDFQTGEYKLTYYPADDTVPDPSALTIGAKTRRISFSRS
jgi:hypothetical protein